MKPRAKFLGLITWIVTLALAFGAGHRSCAWGQADEATKLHEQIVRLKSDRDEAVAKLKEMESRIAEMNALLDDAKNGSALPIQPALLAALLAAPERPFALTDEELIEIHPWATRRPDPRVEVRDVDLEAARRDLAERREEVESAFRKVADAQRAFDEAATRLNGYRRAVASQAPPVADQVSQAERHLIDAEQKARRAYESTRAATEAPKQAYRRAMTAYVRRWADAESAARLAAFRERMNRAKERADARARELDAAAR